MKFTFASVALLAVSASAVNVKRQEPGADDEILTISVPYIKDSITAFSSEIVNLVTDVASLASGIASDVDSKASRISSYIGSAVADGITLSIPALETNFLNTDAFNSYILQLQTKFNPTIISQIMAGQTPAVVSSFIDSLPTEYKTVAAIAFSDAAKQTGTPSNGSTADSSDKPGAAAGGRSSLTGIMAAACGGVAGLAFYL